MEYDLIIIGSGPAGYVAGIRAGQVGLKTVIIEKETVGGICLNWGCIPSKAILESAKKYASVAELSSFGVDGIDQAQISFNWQKARQRSNSIIRRLTKGVEFLLKKNGVETVKGTASITGVNAVTVDGLLYETRNILIATGSLPITIPYDISDKNIITIKELFQLNQLPEYPVIIGENAHAIELAQFFAMVGKSTTLIVPNKRILPDLDKYVANDLMKILKKSGIKIIINPKVVNGSDDHLVTGDEKYRFDVVINAMNRSAVLPDRDINLELDDGFINVNSRLQSNFTNIYAIGDVNGQCGFAHSASAQGLHAVNVISGIDEEYNFKRFPINIYTKPEIAQIGLTEAEARQADIDINISEFTLTANGKALIEGATEGYIRLISEKQYGEVLGVQIMSSDATDLIAEAGVLLQLESTVFDLSKTIHAHPTVSEIFMESGFAAFDQPIHK
ncbi:MAG: dihydrolipoyl dehydrogenase [Candidatus Marinimicrobia bacterium]|nr:dihydrolipoyl dehydrogenase [Candidatus Neomarinimicrobiota bacterium]